MAQREEQIEEQTKLLILMPEDDAQEKNVRLQRVLEYCTKSYQAEIWTKADVCTPIQNRRILFVLHLGEDGINLEYQKLLRFLRRNKNCLKDCIGAVLVDAQSEFYTKAVGRELVFTANQCGCTFPGKPLVEGTASLDNFLVQARNRNTDCMHAYLFAAEELVAQLMQFQRQHHAKPKILAVHASNRETSNTLTLWRKVKTHLETQCSIREIPLQNGTVVDCTGCAFDTCKHFGEQYSCFYGGVMVQEVYPAILDCDALVMICPNYNDAISANLSAFINRLTALFSQTRFYNKAVFAIVVSGYSGGDIVAKQVLGALNMNKTFWLPADFALFATANDPFRIEKIEDIDAKAEAFAQNILRQL